MAELGYTKFQVYDMLFAEVLALRNAVLMRRSHEWEMHRFVGYMVAAAAPGRKSKLPAIHNFLPLLSDRERYAEEVNEREERHRLMGSLYKQYTDRWKN